jgi:hypothetical protein
MYIPDGDMRCRGPHDVDAVGDDKDEVVEVHRDDVEEVDHE